MVELNQHQRIAISDALRWSDLLIVLDTIGTMLQSRRSRPSKAVTDALETVRLAVLAERSHAAWSAFESVLGRSEHELVDGMTLRGLVGDLVKLGQDEEAQAAFRRVLHPFPAQEPTP